MDRNICSVNPSTILAVSRQIDEIQESGWNEAQILESLKGSRVRAKVAARIPAAESGKGRADGDFLGFVLARRIADVLEIDLVGVRPGSRRQGIARALLEALIEDENLAGPFEARLELAAANEPALCLYVGLAFVVVGRRTRYYPDGDDALLLSRQVSSS